MFVKCSLTVLDNQKTCFHSPAPIWHSSSWQSESVLVPYYISCTLQSYLTALNDTFWILTVMQMIHNYTRHSGPASSQAKKMLKLPRKTIHLKMTYALRHSMTSTGPGKTWSSKGEHNASSTSMSASSSHILPKSSFKTIPTGFLPTSHWFWLSWYQTVLWSLLRSDEQLAGYETI